MRTHDASLALLLPVALSLATGCTADAPPVTAPAVTAPAATVTLPPPVASTTATATEAAPAPPTASASAEAPPASAPKSAAEIVASLPATGVVQLPNGGKVTIQANDHIIVEGPGGRNQGESSCGANGFVYKKTVQLFAELQDALRAGDKEKVAELVLYALRVNVTGGQHFEIKDRAALVREYARVFPPKLVARVLAADPREVFCRYNGFMLDSGTLWANVDPKGHYGLFAINP